MCEAEVLYRLQVALSVAPCANSQYAMRHAPANMWSQNYAYTQINPVNNIKLCVRDKDSYSITERKGLVSHCQSLHDPQGGTRSQALIHKRHAHEERVWHCYRLTKGVCACVWG